MKQHDSTGCIRTTLLKGLLTLAAAVMLAGCPGSEPLVLRELVIDPDPAAAGAVLHIEFVASRAASEVPVVTVAGEPAMPTAEAGAGGDRVRYIYNYSVTGDEPEGEAPVVAVCKDGRRDEVSIEGTVVLDFTPPAVTDLNGPDDPTEETSATLTFGCSEEGCVFTCSLEGDARGEVSTEAGCESGITYDGLSPDEYTFTVTATDLAGNESEQATWAWTVEDLAPPPAAELVVSGIPSPIVAGTVASVTIEALDELGSRATGYAGTVSFTSSDGAADLPSNYTFAVQDEGLATLSVVLKTAGTQSVTVTDVAEAGITGSQEGIEVQPNAAAHLVFSVQPGDVIETAHIAPAVEVEIEDAFGNLVLDATHSVMLTLQGGDSAATLSGGNADATGGIAVFGELSVDRAGTGYSLLAVSGGLTTATSTTFDVLDSPEIELLFPSRTWPDNPLDLELKVLGAGLVDGITVIWDAGGSEEELVPTQVEPDRLWVTLNPDLWNGRLGQVPVALDLDGVRSNTVDFVVGGVLPDTGQTACYDGQEELISCPAPGSDFYGQDAQFGWDVHIGPDDRFFVSGQVSSPIVLDRVTQIEWQGCVAGLSGNVCQNGEAQATTWQDAVDYCDGLDWGGYQDWYLPSLNALASIVDWGIEEGAPTINEAAFPTTPQTYGWTSTSYHDDSAEAWRVNFFGGGVRNDPKSHTRHVRCSRGGAEPFMAFARSAPVAGQPVVRDSGTDLMWQGCSAGQDGDGCEGDISTMTWMDALAYCEALDWGGHADWRLPDVNEARSIVSYSRANPAIDVAAFPGTASSFYWSSSSYAYNPSAAWHVRFDHGSAWAGSKATSHYVRCVRGGTAP